ncbi:MAG: HAMP domain-containing histidine kinase [Chloroflexi bacterium]|nr:HAMP domain-containing histidine kinase [Chloroflexota bacterium]
MLRFDRALHLPLAVTLLLVALVLDLLEVPTEFITVVFALSMLAAARRLSPQAAAAFAVGVLGLAVANAAIHHPRLEPAAVRLLTLALVAYPSYLVAMRSHQARQAQQHWQRFLGLVAHDLRRPVATIPGYAQLLARSSTPLQVREHALGVVQAEARRMERRLTDLADVASAGAGALQVQPQPTDLVPVARRVVESQRASFPLHRIELEVPDQLTGVWDPDRLTQVLDTLVGNAIKCNPAGGEVRVRLQGEHNQAVISVSDQGKGIRAQDLPLLFQPFSHLYTERATCWDGLGLYIAQAIVQAHGGRIWASSPGPGQGTVFTFTLPLPGQPPPAGGVWPVALPRPW